MAQVSRVRENENVRRGGDGEPDKKKWQIKRCRKLSAFRKWCEDRNIVDDE